VVPGRFLFGTGVASRRGVRSGPSTEKPFVFSKIEEKGDEGSSEAAGKEVGTITLRVKRVERIGHRAANGLQSIPSPRGNRAVGDHCVGFGQEKPSTFQYPQTWSIKMKDKPSTYVTFVFRYRSGEFLLAQGIMPDPEPPLSIPAKRELPVRLIASEPATPLMSGGPITPCPSPGPSSRKNSHTGSAAKQELLGKGRTASVLFRELTRVKQMPDIHKSITMGGDKFPGQGMLLFNAGLAMASAKEEALNQDESEEVVMADPS